MKRILFGIALLWLSCLGLSAQEVAHTSPYLFDKFQDCLIVYKDGRQFAAPVNYHLIQKHFVFMDPEQKEKEFSDPELIAVLRIGERSFLPEKQSAVEVVQAEPMFCAIYAGEIRKAPKKTSYGGTTQTASVDNYSGLSSNGLVSGVQVDDRMVAGIKKSYRVKIGKRTKRFYNKKSFLKLFPEDKRNELDRYIDGQQVDFNSVDQVLKLFNYAVSK